MNLGPAASAALPALWKALARRAWTHADFARAAGLTSGGATKLLYGDVDAGRRLAQFCEMTLGVRVLLWDKPCPPNWRPHNTAAPKPKPRRRDDADLAPTGTD
jgi:hypothetical protein